MLFQKEIPVKYSTDICVIGGGPSGIAAAVSAARQGANVFLIEQQGCFGGASTNAFVPTFVDFSDGVNFLAGGIGQEIYDRCVAENPQARVGHNTGYQVEALKRQYDDMIISSGINFLFFTSFVDVMMQGNVVNAIVVHGKSGLFAIKAKVFIDCTGDGDLCAAAGAPFVLGDNNGQVMGATLCSLWEDVDWTIPCPPQDSFLEKAFEDKVFTQEDRHLPGIFVTGPNSGGGNIGHAFGVSGINEEELTRGMIDGRRILPEYEHFYRNYVGGPFKNARPIITGTVLGIRESRRILGDYVLTIDDYHHRATFNDEIGRFFYPIDIHVNAATKEAYDAFLKEFHSTGDYCGENYGIPYRCLTPKGLDNVYVAGRCISTDRGMQASIRVMPCCFITGQAAGIAAAMCAEVNLTTRQIDISCLQHRLLSVGAYLPNISSI